MTPLESTIDKLLDKRVSFSIYIPPHTQKPHLVAGRLMSMKEGMELENGCFIFAPFCSNSCKSLAIAMDYSAEGEKGVSELVERIPTVGNLSNKQQTIPTSINYVDYISLISETVKKIDADEFQKVVISRVINTDNHLKTPAKLFAILAESNMHSYRYIVNTPETGIWMGATPELLCSVDKNMGRTISLAGTKASTTKKEWGEKELYEQHLVTEYIFDQLSCKGISNIKQSEPETAIAGKVCHLRTNFGFCVDNCDILPNVVNALHPTPAVCGLPKKAAQQFIIDNERYQREYYSGYLGVYKQNKKAELFVNLRCMKIVGNKVSLYVGGGITADSDPESEWKETQLKAQTMLQILETG